MTPEQRQTTTILALAIDPKEDLQRMIDRIVRETGRAAPDFPFLSDPDHRVIDRYGLLNPGGRGWPHPTVFVIDRSGTVRWKFIEVNYKIRPTNEMILEALTAVTPGGP